MIFTYKERYVTELLGAPQQRQAFNYFQLFLITLISLISVLKPKHFLLCLHDIYVDLNLQAAVVIIL